MATSATPCSFDLTKIPIEWSSVDEGKIERAMEKIESSRDEGAKQVLQDYIIPCKVQQERKDEPGPDRSVC